MCLTAAFALAFPWNILRSCMWSRHVPRKRRFTFNGVHGVISRKTELSTANLCMNPHHTRLFHAQYDKWCIRGSRERASNPHSARGLKRQSFSLVFGRLLVSIPLRAERHRVWSSSSGRGKIFLLFTGSRRVLGPTQPPVKWLTEALPPG
jgi:hypothetical protein